MSTFITTNSLYQRQATLLGQKGQEKIRALKVLVVGLGGLGCPSLLYLASAGVGKIGMVDFDRVSASNLQRQVLFLIQDVDRLKVDAAKKRLKAMAPFTEFISYPVFFSNENGESLISEYDLVLDCSDNFSTKFLMHDLCFKLKKVLVSASVYQYEGSLQVYDFRKGEGPCMRCLWKNEPKDGCVGTCAEVGVLGPLLGVMGSLQACEALKITIGKDHLKNGENLFVDLLSLSFDLRRFKKRADCFCETGMGREKTDCEITFPPGLEDYTVIDVRPETESHRCEFVKKLKSKNQVKFLHIPLEEIDEFNPQPETKYLTLCTRGIRSSKACSILRQKHREVYSLQGGANAHMEKINE